MRAWMPGEVAGEQDPGSSALSRTIATRVPNASIANTTSAPGST